MNGKCTVAHYIESLSPKFEDRTAIQFKAAFRTFGFTYREMRERCLRVANYFDQKGLKKGDRVIIWSYNGPEYAALLLGCAFSGVVAVPIDFSSGADFVQLIAEKVEAKLVFRSRRRLMHGGPPSVLVEELEEELVRVEIARTDFEVQDDDVFEIVYTSGTTSDPKGVVITNGNIVSNITNSARVMSIPERSSFLSILPLSHMFEQVAGFFYALHNGATITYLHSRKSSAIVSAFQRYRINVMLAVPVFLSVLRESILREVRARGREDAFARMLALAQRLPRPLRRLIFRSIHKKFGGRLDIIMSGGSALDPELGQFWSALGLRILQGYGLTEASPVVSMNTLAFNRPGSVGRGLPDQEVRLAAENEIWIRGPHVTPGYLNNPAENAARFEDGWYKTGDIGEIDNDGYIFIRGRLKNMIKSASGVNVYPEDIEPVLNKIDGVKDSCVIGLEERGDVRVHAVLLMEKDREWEDESARPLIEQANRSLQPHQHIQGFSLWPHEDFPRTHTLKIKRGPVAEEIREGRAAGGAIAQASGDRLYDVLAEMANVDPRKLTPDTNLVLDLGMDSIARVELATLLEEEFNVEIDESAVDAETTIAGLQEIIAARQKETTHYEFPRWARWWVIRPIRWFLQLILLRVTWLWSRLNVRGREHLKGLKTPVILISNHINHYDVLYIMRALPRRLRRLAIGAAADILYEYQKGEGLAKWIDVRLRGYWTTLFMHTFPFSRSVHVKKSFEYMGELIDNDWNVLLFPEGKLTMTGEMAPFKGGIGMVAQAMKVPIVPMRIDGLFHLVKVIDGNRAGWTPQNFCHVTLTFGKPLDVDPNAHPDEIAKQCEDAIRNLGAGRDAA